MATKKKGGAKNKVPSSMGRKTAAMMVEPAKGKLGVMVVGLGAVATTMIAGVEAVRRGLAKPDRVAHADGHHPPGQAHR